MRRITCLLLAVLFIGGAAQAQSLIVRPNSVTFDSLHNRYLVSCWATRQIVAIDQQENQSVYLYVPVDPGYGPRGSYVDGSTFYLARGYMPGGLIVVDLETDEMLHNITVPNSGALDGMATDTSGNLWVVDMDRDRLYRFDLSDMSYSIVADYTSELPGHPQDVAFDEVNNRLIIVGMDADAPLVEVSLPDITLSVLAPTPGGLDGVTLDNQGNIYVSVHFLGEVWAYDSDGTNQRVTSTGHGTEVAGLQYNRRDEVLAISVWSHNRVDFLSFGDADQDNVLDYLDNCLLTYNPGQDDSDTDSFGDSCDICPGFSDSEDADEDEVPDGCDNCPDRPNPGQEDSDSDGIGDACCCVGLTGNVDYDPSDVCDMGDLTALIVYLFIPPFPEPLCMMEANVDGTGTVDVGDLTRMIDYLFISKIPVIKCP